MGVSILGGGAQYVTTAGTAIALSTTSAPCQFIMASAISTNTALVTICNSTAKGTSSARVGVSVYPGSTAQPVTIFVNDLSHVFIDGVSTEGISYIYYG